VNIRRYVPRRVLFSVHNSLIVLYLNYGICAWRNYALIFQIKIVALQKRAFRLIYLSKSKEHTVRFFLKSNCFPLPNLFFTRIVAFYCTISRDTAPFSIRNKFVKTGQIHNYRPRSVSSDPFYAKLFRTNKMHEFFSRIGAQN